MNRHWNYFIVDYTQAGTVSILRFLKGFICVVRVGNTGGLTLFTVPLLKWIPSPEFKEV